MALTPKAVFLLFIVILIEGYVVLSTELLAIRLTIPYVGSGTDTVSIIIAAVLMPLAFGYYNGGRFKPYKTRGGKVMTVRRKLINNITISTFFVTFAVSYIPLSVFFVSLKDMGITMRLLATTIYAVLFLVTPVYLLGQTIPLVSNFFSKETLARITGKMLFFSTVGSFLGATFSTLVLMAFIGVHYTATINILLLLLLYFLLEKKFKERVALPLIAVAVIGIIFNSGYMMKTRNIVANNKYNTIIIKEQQGRRIISLNNNFSSAITPDGRMFKYGEFIKGTFINKAPADAAPNDILVIGTGGFSLSARDAKNKYDYVDIDGSLKDVAETHFLQRRLKDNVTFYPVPARAYLSESTKQYDIVVLDTFTGATSIPEHLVTQNFFQQVYDAMKPDGLLVINTIADPNFASAFSRHFDTTLRSVFPYVSRRIIQDYDGWDRHDNRPYNVIYSAHKWPEGTEQKIYTDNKNTFMYDKPLR